MLHYDKPSVSLVQRCISSTVLVFTTHNVLHVSYTVQGFAAAAAAAAAVTNDVCDDTDSAVLWGTSWGPGRQCCDHVRDLLAEAVLLPLWDTESQGRQTTCLSLWDVSQHFCALHMATLTFWASWGMQFALLLLLKSWTVLLGRKPTICDVHALKFHLYMNT